MWEEWPAPQVERLMADAGFPSVKLARIGNIYFDRNQIEAAKKYYDALIEIDSTGVGDPIYEDLKGLGLRIRPNSFTNESKKSHTFDAWRLALKM